jgi:hypothetical protein
LSTRNLLPPARYLLNKSQAYLELVKELVDALAGLGGTEDLPIDALTGMETAIAEVGEVDLGGDDNNSSSTSSRYNADDVVSATRGGGGNPSSGLEDDSPMDVHFHSVEGGVVTLSVSASTKVAEIKALLHRQQQLPRDAAVRLVFAGRELGDNSGGKQLQPTSSDGSASAAASGEQATLGRCGVRQNSSVRLVVVPGAARADSAELQPQVGEQKQRERSANTTATFAGAPPAGSVDGGALSSSEGASVAHVVGSDEHATRTATTAGVGTEAVLTISADAPPPALPLTVLRELLGRTAALLQRWEATPAWDEERLDLARQIDAVTAAASVGGNLPKPVAAAVAHTRSVLDKAATAVAASTTKRRRSSAGNDSSSTSSTSSTSNSSSSSSSSTSNNNNNNNTVTTTTTTAAATVAASAIITEPTPLTSLPPLVGRQQAARVSLEPLADNNDNSDKHQLAEQAVVAAAADGTTSTAVPNPPNRDVLSAATLRLQQAVRGRQWRKRAWRQRKRKEQLQRLQQLKQRLRKRGSKRRATIATTKQKTKDGKLKPLSKKKQKLQRRLWAVDGDDVLATDLSGELESIRELSDAEIEAAMEDVSEDVSPAEQAMEDLRDRVRGGVTRWVMSAPPAARSSGCTAGDAAAASDTTTTTTATAPPTTTTITTTTSSNKITTTTNNTDDGGGGSGLAEARSWDEVKKDHRQKQRLKRDVERLQLEVLEVGWIVAQQQLVGVASGASWYTSPTRVL